LGAKVGKKWDWQGKNEIFSSKKLAEWEINCNFEAPEPAKPLNDAQMCGSFYFRM